MSLPEQLLSIEERRTRNNEYVVTPDMKLVNIMTGEATMTHAEWMERGREIGVRARVALIDKNIPSERRGRTPKQDENDLAALAAMDIWNAAHEEDAWRAELSPGQQEVRSAMDKVTNERLRADYKRQAMFVGALSILENAPDSDEGKELASHIKRSTREDAAPTVMVQEAPQFGPVETLAPVIPIGSVA